MLLLYNHHITAIIFLCTVPIPSVSITALNQSIGNTLALRCDVRIVKGITSKVDIVWKVDGIEILRYNGNISENHTYYVYYFDSSKTLTANDNNTIYQCEIIINRSPVINTTDSLMLSLSAGKHSYTIVSY